MKKIKNKIKTKSVEKKLNFRFNAQKVEIGLTNKQFEDIVCYGSHYVSTSDANTIKLSSDFFSSTKRVPNIIRYKLSYKKGGWELRRFNGNDLGDFDCDCKKGVPLDANNSEKDYIFLILESPHKNEYKDDMVPIAPAFGSTGKNIHSYFTEKVISNVDVAKYLNIKIDYSVCLINPVPYQTSLGNLYSGKIKHKLRDAVWKKIFETTKHDFLDCIIKYKPALILNACTKTLAPEILSVLTDIKGVFPKRIDHPSRWSLSATQLFYDYKI